MQWSRRIAAVALGALGALAAGAAHAQATGTWVSGVGDDSNPCSRTAPCLTFSVALSRTANKGTVRVLDPGQYGPVTITKAITIVGLPGATIISSPGVNGITVNANAADVVVLANLTIDGGGSGVTGVLLNTASMLVLENVNIQGTGTGVDVAAAAVHARVDIRGCDIGGAAIAVRNQSPTSTVTVEGSSLHGNGTALSAVDGMIAVIGTSLVNNGLVFSSVNGTTWTGKDNAVYGNANLGNVPGRQKHIATE